ncbi:MAG: glutamine cyclotransferase [Bacteroidetes bacterium HGW-Bacteroidetes-2]|nr:MAG: glutamine cyclotransferase [Bacteroidetes bacterium HGW-Bacteroidetes-2]
MKLVNAFLFALTLSLLISCGDKKDKKKSSFSIEFNGNKQTYTLNDVLRGSIKNAKENEIDSIIYHLNDKRIGKEIGLDFSFGLTDEKLGSKFVQATIYHDALSEVVSKEIVLLATTKPKLYTYKIINTYPHDINAYTQGLEFHGDTLYESTGQYGKSSLRKTNYKTGEVLQQVDLERNYFGEGLTILNKKVYQLTWKEKVGFIYNLQTLEKTGNFVYGKSIEGWGLCNDSEVLYKSDGTEKIWTLNPDNLTEESYIEIYTNTSRIKSVNELEWVEGKIYANVYQQNAIAIINPKNGSVEGVIDLSSLQTKVKQHPSLDVLNGIAYKGEKNKLFVTGKNWNLLFEIEILEKQ